MNYTTITYAGLTLDTFITEDGRTWLTLSSLAKGIDVHQQTVINWLRRHSAEAKDTLDVRVGRKRNVKATAYPVTIAADFLNYLVSKGNTEANALITATLVADLERSIMEANGYQVNAAQHEETRRQTRLEYLVNWGTKAKEGREGLSVEEIRA